ncbi:MAG: hypothetical protein UFX66_04350, partial [Collinsella aerofaciens]|nr:hypothetical protein [Collinsella aerofaciens]
DRVLTIDLFELESIAPLPVLNPAKGRIFCNYKKMIGQDVNHGLTEPFLLSDMGPSVDWGQT